DTPVGPGVERVSNEVAANETGAAGDEYVKHALRLYHPHTSADVVHLIASVASRQRSVLPNARKKFEKVPSPASTKETLKRRSDGIGADETRWKFWDFIC